MTIGRTKRVAHIRGIDGLSEQLPEDESPLSFSRLKGPSFFEQPLWVESSHSLQDHVFRQGPLRRRLCSGLNRPNAPASFS